MNINIEPLNSEDDNDITLKLSNFFICKENDFEPKVGVVLSNEDEAYNFYNAYAKKAYYVKRISIEG